MELTDVFKEPVYTVLYSGAVNNVGDWKKNEHSHNFGEILFVKKGRGQIRINGEKRSVRYGDLVIYNPGDVHRESSYENEEFGILFVTLRPVGRRPRGSCPTACRRSCRRGRPPSRSRTFSPSSSTRWKTRAPP